MISILKMRKLIVFSFMLTYIMEPSTEVNGITLLRNQHEITIRYREIFIKWLWLSVFLKERINFKAEKLVMPAF